MEIRSGTAKFGDLDIYYEEMGDQRRPSGSADHGPGLAAAVVAHGFCEKLVAEGLRVIRYDNRDVGLSSKTERRKTGAALIPRMVQVLAGDPRQRGLHGSRTWPTTPPRCSITSRSTARTSSAARWAA